MICRFTVILLTTAFLQTALHAADWAGYEKLTREQVIAAVAAASPGAPADLQSRNLSGVDLSGVDFKGANLTAAVLNGANLSGANLSRCNLTVSFAEGANLAGANLQGAMMFSMQLKGASLKAANLSGARLIGDLRGANLEQAVLTRMDAAADMKNQSMGLMRTNLTSANLKGANLSDSDFSRADFSFSDLSGADLRGARLLDTDFRGANLAGADLGGAAIRGAKGLENANAQEGGVLRVCSDPNNLPFSNRAGEGFENKIAELFARELGWKLEYTWFPQRMGFIRNTLRARNPDTNRFKCDLVMGVPVGFDLASTTKAYYRSTYALAYVRGNGLDSVTTPDALMQLPPAKLKSLKFGIVAQTPPVDWLLRHKLFNQAVPYDTQPADPERYPGEMVEKDLRAGRIDVAFAWGPIAGYFGKMSGKVKTGGKPLVVVPFPPDPQIRFDYPIAMGVRFGEKDYKARIEELIAAKRAEISAILEEYGVPQLDDAGKLISR